jgi:hypothetical protein
MGRGTDDVEESGAGKPKNGPTRRRPRGVTGSPRSRPRHPPLAVHDPGCVLTCTPTQWMPATGEVLPGPNYLVERWSPMSGGFDRQLVVLPPAGFSSLLVTAPSRADVSKNRQISVFALQPVGSLVAALPGDSATKLQERPTLRWPLSGKSSMKFCALSKEKRWSGSTCRGAQSQARLE